MLLRMDEYYSQIRELRGESPRGRESSDHGSNFLMRTGIAIHDSKTQKHVVTVTNLAVTSDISDVKREFCKSAPGKSLHADRVSFRAEPRGKSLKDEEKVSNLGLTSDGKLYFKDLGPQISWTGVFLAEYTGPLIVYLLFYSRPAQIYGPEARKKPMELAAHIACACWCFHYGKRLLETVFVHRFSHATMPIRNLLKNCSYYWGFSGFVAYYVNHPLYTPPLYGDLQLYGALAAFLFCQLGNFSIHIAFRNMRSPGSKERRIPRPSSNPMTWLFALVSCPNYTYEVGSWLSFSIMAQSLPALFFATCGFYQMTVWAIGKHRNYKKEFKNYPNRKAIVPFLM